MLGPLKSFSLSNFSICFIRTSFPISGDECPSGFYLDKSDNEEDSNKFTTSNKQPINQVNELDLLFDNYVISSSSDSTKFGQDTAGCVPCECNSFGSINSSCNQTTGVCNCKFGVNGDKCDYCVHEDKLLTELGCVASEFFSFFNLRLTDHWPVTSIANKFN